MTKPKAIKSITPTSLFNNLSKNKLPPVETWDPPFCGNIDICIHKDGHWSYNNSAFTRASLVKLLASVLKKEQDDYFLVTPAEKIGIKVEAEPFITKHIEVITGDQNCIVFTTTLEDKVIAGTEHPINVFIDSQGQPYPTIHIRANLHALISRSDYYQLIDFATSTVDPKDNNKMKCAIKSQGIEFILGYY